MTKKGRKQPARAKQAAKRIKTKGSAKGPGITDVTDALAAAMARLKAAQISRLLGDAVPASLPDEAEAFHGAPCKKKARKARKEVRRAAGKAVKQAEKEARGARKRAAKEAGPQLNDSGT